jgi:hypothetical protein
MAIWAEVCTGVELVQFSQRTQCERPPAIGRTLKRIVVHEHEHAVAGHVEIELDAINPERHGLEQRRDRVFGRVGTVAAMADDRPRGRVTKDHDRGR